MTKYKVSNSYTTEFFNNLNEVTNYIRYTVSDEAIIDLLDDIYGPVRIGSLTYSAGNIIYKMDRLTFNKSKDEYVNGLLLDMKYDIEEQGEEEVYYLGYTIQVIED